MVATGRKKGDGKVTPFSRELKRLMQQRDLCLTDVSKMTKISKSTLSGWLSSSATPADLLAVKRLADVLGVSMSRLCTGQEDQVASKANTNEVVELIQNGQMQEGYYRVLFQKLEPKN